MHRQNKFINLLILTKHVVINIINLYFTNLYWLFTLIAFYIAKGNGFLWIVN